MNNLWIFGDSYSEPFYKPKMVEWKLSYIKWKGYIPNCYGQTLSQRLNLYHSNQAIGGGDNYSIFDSIILNLEKIKPNDIIIIGWSHTLRFRVVSKSNTFNTIRPSSLESVFKLNSQYPYLDLSDDTLKEISINRDSNLYVDEINNYIQLLNFVFKNNKIIHWSPFGQDKDGLCTTNKSLIEIETIKRETNGDIDDTHYSENGHNRLTDEFINIIDNYDLFKSKKSLI